MARSQSPVMTCRRSGVVKEAAVMTMSASMVASRPVATARAPAIPAVAAAAAASASARAGSLSKMARSTPGSEIPEDLEVAVPLDAGTDDGGARWTPAEHRRRRPEARDRHAGDRGGPLRRDRPAIEDRRGLAGRRVVQDDDGVDGRQATGPIVGAAGDPLDAEPVARPVARGTAQERRHRVRERAVRPGMHADLGRQVGIGDERRHRPLREREPLGHGRHRGSTSAAARNADGGWHARSVDAR